MEINKEEIGADIRNKLSPPKNLIALLEDYFNEKGVLDRDRIEKYIKISMDDTKKSIEYLANLF